MQIRDSNDNSVVYKIVGINKQNIALYDPSINILEYNTKGIIQIGNIVIVGLHI